MQPTIPKQWPETISIPVSDLFKSSLDLQQVPRERQQAAVTPIFEMGDRENPACYWSVVLLPIYWVAMKLLMNEEMSKYMNRNNTLHEDQHRLKKQVIWI